MAPRANRTCGFTLGELLTALAIIALLVGMLAAGGLTIREKARGTATLALVTQLTQSLTIYRDEDSRRRFPPARADQTLRYDPRGAYAGTPVAVADLLLNQGFAIHGDILLDDAAGTLVVDRWRRPIRYQQDALVDGSPDRPLDAAGQPVRVPEDVADWNPRGEQPYAYVWSRGRPRADDGLRTQAGQWLYFREGP